MLSAGDDTEMKKYREGGSSNYDDSGFFSVQVIHQALKIWDLDLLVLGAKEQEQCKPLHIKL